MTLSVRQTTSATPALRALLAEWDADHAATPQNATGPPATDKDVVLAFRTRPPLDSDVVPESELENLDDDDGPIDTSFLRGVTATGDIMVAHVPATSWKGHSLQHKEFKADICFGPDTAQDDVYAKAIEDCNMIELALNGGLSCVLAYGQTGSGKTHTIGGLEERIAHNLFAKAEVIGARFKQAHGDTSNDPVLSFHVTFLELLGRNAYDLSTPPVDPEDDAEVAARRKVDIMEDKLGDVRPQLKSTLVQSPDELQALITRCLSHRRTTATLKNPRSSRSHAVLTIWVKNRILPQLDDGQIVLVDLAGSERYDDAKHHTRQLMDESRETNKSLMALKDCVRARARATEADTFVHVPYRTNKLTLLLKALFDLESRQQTRTLVIAHVSPHMRDAHHSASTLSYAAPFRSVAPATQKIVEVDEADPRTWDHPFAYAWLDKGLRIELGKLTSTRKALPASTPLPFDLSLFLPAPLGGLHLCKMYSAEWLATLPPLDPESKLKLSREKVETAAYNVYITFCERLRIARTKGRHEVLRPDKEAVDRYMASFQRT